MTTQDLLRPAFDDGGRRPDGASPAVVTPLAHPYALNTAPAAPMPLNPPPAVEYRDVNTPSTVLPAAHLEDPAAVTPPDGDDPDATVVIGRHRADGTCDTRAVERTRRGGWLARVPVLGTLLTRRRAAR